MKKYMRIMKKSLPSVKNVILRDFTQQLKPTRIWYEVTDRCNSRCKGCNIWRKTPKPNPLTVDEIEQTFRDPLFSDMKYILNSGGEPVVRKDIADVLLAEHRALPNAALHMSTNGIAKERILRVAETMLRHDIPLEIGISLDGIGADHDEVRGVPGNFEKTEGLLKELVLMKERSHCKIKPLVGFTLTHQTIDYYEDVKSYTDELGLPLCVQWYNESTFYDNVGKVSQGSIEQKRKRSMD